MRDRYKHWFAALGRDDKVPAYRKIVQLISTDIEKGLLQSQERMPPLRDMAALLGLNYSTVAKAYNEACNRGLIESRRGMGSFVRGKMHTLSPRDGSDVEMTMNSPPVPASVKLQEVLKAESAHLFAHCDIHSLLRYQDFGGTEVDKLAGVKLLSGVVHDASVDRMLVCPGIHSVLLALLSLLVEPGKALCVPELVYPGLKAIAAQLRVSVKAVNCDGDGMLISAVEAMCKTGEIAAIYVNPTLQNPTTRVMTPRRREALADLAMRYSIPIIEDDAYALVPEKPVSAIANLAPQLTYYVTGLSKCFGPGLRVAYLHAPSKLLAKRTAGALRALSVMASPITNTLATKWINSGTVSWMASSIREEGRKRQRLAARYFSKYRYEAHPDGFHLWLNLPDSVEVDSLLVAGHLRSQQVGVVSSAAFCTNNNPPRALRLCLGGATKIDEFEESLKLVVDILEHPSHLRSISF